MKSAIPAGPPAASLGEWLTEVLKQRIVSGGYQPGAWIREPALQREFGVSNGPVREALQNLVSSGILVREARRGVRVVSLTDAEVIELFEVRLALFELAAEIVAGDARSVDLARARSIAEATGRAVAERDVEALTAAGGALVDWVFSSTGNRQLVETWEQLTLRARVYIYAALRNCRDLDDVGRLWCCLVSAIADGDCGKARKTARAMVLRTLDDLDLKGRF